MKSIRSTGLWLAAVITAGLPAPSALASEIEYVSLFDGSWAGSGMILNNGTSLRVSCRAHGKAVANRVTVEGDRSLGFISMKIAADIAYDPTSGRYVGTYLGDPVGLAHVSGKRSGDVVNLVIAWPKLVNGDTRGRMTITNSGSGSLRIVVLDNITPGGQERWTSDLSLLWVPETVPVVHAR